MTLRTRRHRVLVVGILFVVVVGVVAWSVRPLPALGSRDVSFAVAFVHFAVMLGTFNVLDCFVLDWALVYWQPRFMVLPGTEGMASYTDYWFHVRGFFIGIPIVLAASAFFGAIVSFLM